MTIRFDDALAKALELLDRHMGALRTAGNLVVVRDLYGGLHLAMSTKPPRLEQLWADWKADLGKFAPGTMKATFFYKDEMFDPDAVFNASEAWATRTPVGLNVTVLDRQGIGQDWQRAPLNPLPKPAIVFYGLKGGVGRSTALVALAGWLIQREKKVLIFDLDLESPGTTHLLSSNAEPATFGIVDWLVEDAVGQASDLEAGLARACELPGAGTAWLVPAHGQEAVNYLPKLARAYLDSRGVGGKQHFGERLHRLCQSQIELKRPDVVLIDSRAGLHDIAAVAITHLASLALLFAGASEQTWKGYGLLFDHWRERPHLATKVRDKLKVVASMIPETRQDEYLAEFQRQSWDTFQKLYDQNGDFNFNADAEEAPHNPLKIYWHRAFMEFGLNLLGTQPFHQAMADFPAQLAKLAGIQVEEP